MKFEKICVMGLGYIGLPTASTFAQHGLKVIGVDVNTQIVDILSNGGLHIHEPGLAELLQLVKNLGNLSFSNQPEEADAFIIAVPTPFYHDEQGNYHGQHYKLADMRAVQSATQAIVPYLREGNLVILESTSPPRTTVDLVGPILEQSGLKVGESLHLAYSPERVLPGQILRELIENARVIGGVTPESAKAGAELYAQFVKGDIIQTDATTAEMVKLMENTYRDVNIAIANEFSLLADRFGIDVWEAIQLANLHPRVQILNPGPGVGGHCISVDPWFFVEGAPELTKLIYTARMVNDAQPSYVVSLTQRALGSLEGKRISALGLTYKPDVDDLRESPAVSVVQLLQEAGASVICYEPFSPNANLPGLPLAPTLEAALENSDAILLLVNHREFQRLHPEDILAKTPARLVIDTVNGLQEFSWKSSGFRFFRLGVRKQST